MSALTPVHLNIMFEPEYAVPSFGFVVPPLALVIVVINGCMVWILTRRNMRSPANILLVCIALSDTLAILLPVPSFIYFYTLRHYKDFVPFAWCRMFFNFVHVFPLLCNMASLWATVALAFMRCYSVWRPLKARATITIRKTFIAIVLIYAFSTLVYSPLMFEYSYTPLSTNSMVKDNSTILTCHMQKNHFHLSESFCIAHTWIQIIFTSLLPWFLITFPDFGLLWKLKRAEDDRRELHNGCQDAEKNEKAFSLDERNRKLIPMSKVRTRRTTLVVFIVVSMVWIVEIPFAIVFTRYLAHNHGDVMRNNLGNAVVFVFLLKYVTYPIIFLIYCFMSGKFRQTFKDCFLCKVADKHSRRSTNSRDTRETTSGSSRSSA